MTVYNKKIYNDLELWFNNHNLTWIKNNTIFLTIHGSKCYGTDTPESDTDIKGLALPPKEYLFGFSKNFEQAEASNPYDMVIFSLQKFMKLAAETNPNILEIINTDEINWIYVNPIFYKLYDNRYLFISKKARYTFGRYATSQFKKMQSHRNWLLNPPKYKPTREEYGLSETTKMSQSNLGVINSLINNGKEFSNEVMDLFQKEQRYNSAKKDWDQYKNWEKTRNKKRAILENKIHYDSKNALHLVRLILMCKEILSEGKVIVNRPDKDFLKEIRNGMWTYEQIVEWVEKQEEIINDLYLKSTLPTKPNYEKINDLCVEIFEEFYNEN